MSRPPVPLSRYLAGNILFFMVPLFLVSALSLWAIANQTRRSFLDLSSLSSSLVSSRFEEFFARPREAATHLAEILDKPELYSRSRLAGYLESNLESFPYIDRIQIVGPDDRVIALAPPDPSAIGISRKGELVYEAVKRATELSWSESYISTRNNLPAITFGTKAGGDILLCDLDLAWVGKFAESIEVSPTSNLNSTRGVEIRITDGKGVYLSNVDSGRVSRRETMPDFGRLKAYAESHAVGTLHADDKVWLVSSSRISDPGWYVFVLYPESIFTDSLYSGFARLMILFLATGIAASLVWRLRFRRVSAALATISKEAARISRGDYGELNSFGSGFAEFSRIGASLNAMVGAIGMRERVLLDRERGFRETLERIDLVVVSIDSEGRIVYVNPSLLYLSGYSREGLMGRALVEYMIPGPSGCPFSRLLTGRTILPLERCSFKCHDASIRLIDWSIVPNLDGKGGLAGATGIGHDVTEIVRQHEIVTASLLEKEILLREVHHRVKNNLQIILSLLQLQRDEAENPLVARALGLSADRILSISLVHETIYGSADFSDLDFGEYASAFLSQLLSRQEGRHIRFSARLAPLRLDLIDAVPSGLLVNEAFRFLMDRAASRDGESPHSLTLSVGMMGGLAHVSLSCDCGDPGRGSEAAVSADHHIILMQALADQLHGKLTMSTEAFFEVELVFSPRIAMALS